MLTYGITMTLTNIEIQKAKPREKPYTLPDGGGLYVQVRPNGSKLWRLAYRMHGVQKLVALGPYPQVTLLEARARREQAKTDLRADKTPSIPKEARAGRREHRSEDVV